MADILPEELTRGADLRHGEYAWSIGSFPDALVLAPTLGFACLGGQFQLRPDPNTIYELFWVEANSSESSPESPGTPTQNDHGEVSEQFTSLLRTVDFRKEALKFKSLDSLLLSGKDLIGMSVFNAYFVNESEFQNLKDAGVRV